jgi:inosine/xanthosine triphosphate pyrophosphatase family protein
LRRFGIKLDNAELDLEEIQSVDVEEVVKHKAKQAYDVLKEALIVEDTVCILTS